MPEYHQKADPPSPRRFGPQILPSLGGDGVREVVCALVEGRPVALTLGEDRSARVWDMLDHRQMGRPVTPSATQPVWGVAYGELEQRPVAVLVGGGVRVRDLRSRRQAGPPLFDSRDIGVINSLACGTLHGRPVALAVAGGERVRVWDLEEHRRIGTNAPARYAAQLPTSWRDPATGDVHDLTRPLVDQDGSRWKLVDYDGTEPIVCEYPLSRTTLGIADAHAEYGFDEVVTSRHQA
ncbi:WD40 repeat domain-containing protein [Streptomyces albipurpureus]|uniref:WD40 repeat domain-containing protein n=1 Tax=Streptomyces albipurpureus TaxID=2897419 RepID=A0ABT0V169_9ACTN|nr:WD40 repeat domain-containing protein [Streptomyces sp. CWNU-1]MCM2394085.1 WD40 repeat domain-containing protein [Streptomyces sp. CWNU-1]